MTPYQLYDIIDVVNIVLHVDACVPVFVCDSQWIVVIIRNEYNFMTCVLTKDPIIPSNYIISLGNTPETSLDPRPHKHHLFSFTTFIVRFLLWYLEKIYGHLSTPSNKLTSGSFLFNIIHNKTVRWYIHNVPWYIHSVPWYIVNVPSYIHNIPWYIHNVSWYIVNVPSYIYNVPWYISMGNYCDMVPNNIHSWCANLRIFQNLYTIL